jgi:hypothetical protein
MMEVTKMKKISIGALLVALAVVMAAPAAQAAFTVGGENGWQLSTDGIVNIFAAYQTTSPSPYFGGGVGGLPGAHDVSLLGISPQTEQKFGVRVGLLPSIIAFNVKAPTTFGVDSNVRVGMYINVQNSGQETQTLNASNNHYNTNPNIDVREFFYTAKGRYGELLAGRALNLFQGQNILNDMTLFTAGVVDMGTVRGGTSLGHIAYGYLYTNFGPQFRYTTPDMGGFKFALEVAEPYAISPASGGTIFQGGSVVGFANGLNNGKQTVPRIEAELSYATTFKGGSIHAWLEGIEQTATRGNFQASLNANKDIVIGPVARPGGTDMSLGFAPGFNLQVGPVGIMGSGYYGTGLGMVSTQDGAGFGGNNAYDVAGNRRTNWGFLAQTTYQLTDSIRLAANYGSNRQNLTDWEGDRGGGAGVAYNVKKCQEAVVGQVNWNLNKFTQFTLEYIWAKDTWMDGAQERSNQVALGTVFFW